MSATRIDSDSPGADAPPPPQADAAGRVRPGAPDPRGWAAATLLLALSAGLAWWAWKQGAYFGSVFYPASIGTFALLALLLALAPFDARISGAARLGMAALLALAAWTLLSALWSPAPSFAIAGATQAFLYGGLLLLGLWAANLLGPRMLLALAPVAFAGLLIAIATVATLAVGTDFGWYLHGDATLRFPIGYRNANAAFFMICTWPLLVLAAESGLRWQVRAGMIGAATVLIELAVLAQSRGSLPASAAALVVYLALSPHRLRAGAIAALAAAPVFAALPTLLDVYRHGAADPAVIPPLHAAARAVAVTGIGSVALAAVALRGIYPRLRLGAAGVRRLSRVSAVVMVAVVVIGGGIFIHRHGGPVGFVDQRVAEFSQGGYPDLRSQGVRFGANVGSNRQDFWRVALDQGLDHPVLGGGTGSFQFAYLQDRDSHESPKDPHSMEMLMLSELGVPGLGLLLAFLAAATLGSWRSRRLGPGAAALVTAALASAAQWLLQGSYDWFWHYPGITAPAIYLLGAAMAPALLAPGAGRARRWRAFAAAAAVTLAAASVPLFLAERYTSRALGEARGDPREALADLDRAAGLNPFDDQALLIRGAIASRLGEREEALSSFRDAAGRVPENYAAHYFLARELLPLEPAEAAAELDRAQSLDPRAPEIPALRRRLARSSDAR